MLVPDPSLAPVIGDPGCTTGLSRAFHDALLGSPCGATDGPALRGFCYGLAFAMVPVLIQGAPVWGPPGPTGPAGPPGHSPLLNWQGDQIAIDGTVVGPHLTGPAGAPGAQGAQGASGAAGHSPALTWIGDQIAIDGSVTGPHLTGPQGAQGQQGIQGAQGQTGTTGAPGAAGHSPALTWSGDQIAIDGSVNGPHLTGPQGQQGIQGPPGSSGPPSGPAGGALNGTYPNPGLVLLQPWNFAPAGPGPLVLGCRGNVVGWYALTGGIGFQ